MVEEVCKRLSRGGSGKYAGRQLCNDSFVKDPKQFDVILTENMFGDILSDEASMVTGIYRNACKCQLK